MDISVVKYSNKRLLILKQYFCRIVYNTRIIYVMVCRKRFVQRGLSVPLFLSFCVPYISVDVE